MVCVLCVRSKRNIPKKLNFDFRTVVWVVCVLCVRSRKVYPLKINSSLRLNDHYRKHSNTRLNLCPLCPLLKGTPCDFQLFESWGSWCTIWSNLCPLCPVEKGTHPIFFAFTRKYWWINLCPLCPHQKGTPLIFSLWSWLNWLLQEHSRRTDVCPLCPLLRRTPHNF